jgi:oligoendopeptidase F
VTRHGTDHDLITLEQALGGAEDAADAVLSASYQKGIDLYSIEELGAQFAIMLRENLLDLGNRKGKAQGGYCVSFPMAERPYIFMNAVGLQRDVETILHEAGHAFHALATRNVTRSRGRGPASWLGQR